MSDHDDADRAGADQHDADRHETDRHEPDRHDATVAGPAPSESAPSDSMPSDSAPSGTELAEDAPGELAHPLLRAAGARLRQASHGIDPDAVRAAVYRRRARLLTAVSGVALLAVAVLGTALILQRTGGDERNLAGRRAGAPSSQEVERLVTSLGDAPIDPTTVRLVSTVSTYPTCDALMGDLRKVGAQHVGSRGFGGDSFGHFMRVGAAIDGGDGMVRDAAISSAPGSVSTPTDSGTTLGTNVQVEGVDELDHIKAQGAYIYDLDGSGNLEITDATTLEVVSTLDVTPGAKGDPDHDGDRGSMWVSNLLVSEGTVAVFGSETDISEPIEGDPSATRASSQFLTITFVDASDPAAPTIADRVRIEGSLVSARLVAGEVRLVTTAHMADLGFVMPTTPNSVPKALEANRRAVAGSVTADWIPDWQREGEDPHGLVPCNRVHVPDTFSGVAMTSMVTFPLNADGFDPQGTSILAPGDTLYAGLDRVAISSSVWVDPADRERLEFTTWQTAIHEFSFSDGAAPGYEGSGIVDGSTIGQFAFGELGDSLAVVTTGGTPWNQKLDDGADLTVLTPDGDGGLDVTARVEDLDGGKGLVSAVRFLPDRVLVATGLWGRNVDVLDVSDPSAPRRAGSLTFPASVEYFHPLPDHRALVLATRADPVGTQPNVQMRSWVHVELVDVSDADDPEVVSTWEEPWTADAVGADHHAFTYWPERSLAMWGLRNTSYSSGVDDRINRAAVLSTDGALQAVALPEASQPPEAAPRCPVVTLDRSDLDGYLDVDDVVLGCADPAITEIDWPRYACNLVPHEMLDHLEIDYDPAITYFTCHPRPRPVVDRVLVVKGRVILATDQTFEVLDAETFASTQVVYHPRSTMSTMYLGW